ncbi:MAG: hypothetical protein APR54_04725 [Candidatus Cloacimonas sp. SDB]|nr:MAG: hypothetical protein APR54_04725 [Candidatus Cloacimonas sp. SDB]
MILGNSVSGDADYLNSCRMKRNTLEYDLAGAATEADVKELIEFVTEFKTAAINWLSSNHPEHL